MMAALGGRLGAYRDGRGDDAVFKAALKRNLWRSAPVNEAAVEWVAAEARRVAERLDAAPLDVLASGSLRPVAA